MRNRPALKPWLVLYFETYNRLRGSRRVGMVGAMPIPVSEIESYCNLFYIRTLPERERLFYFVTDLDQHFLAHMHKQQDAPTPRPEKPSK